MSKDTTLETRGGLVAFVQTEARERLIKSTTRSIATLLRLWMQDFSLKKCSYATMQSRPVHRTNFIQVSLPLRVIENRSGTS